MIRYISNSLTDQFGRRNFVDSNGVCVGVKEFPDGNPLLWAVVPAGSDEPLPKDYEQDAPLHMALDREPYVFGDVKVIQSENMPGTEIARIHLISDQEVVNHDFKPDSFDKILYVVISKADNLYFADFKMTVNDKKRLFGNVDNLRMKLKNFQDMVNEVRGKLWGLSSELEGLMTIVDAMDYDKKLIDKETTDGRNGQ